MNKILDWPQNWLLMKNAQFLLKSHETLPKGPPHQYVQLTKFHKIWSKIVDFLLIANFEASLRFY